MRIHRLPELAEPDALSILEEAHARKPGAIDLALELAGARAAAGCSDAARGLVRQVVARPDATTDHVVLASDILGRMQRREEAVRVLRGQSRRVLSRAAYVVPVSRALLAIGDVGAAIRLIDQAARSEPNDPRTTLARIGLERARGRHERAVALCGTYLASRPRSAEVRCLYRRSMLDAGMEPPNWEATDRDLIRRVPVPTGAEYDTGALVRDLLAYLARIEGWVWSPEQFSTQGGDQYREVANRVSIRRPAIRRFVDAIAAAASGYLDTVTNLDPVWFDAAGLNTHLTSWVARLPRGGGHGTHVHPSGWISGVLCLDAGTDASPTEFGRTDAGGTFHLAAIEPVVPGEFVFFPSYLEHRVLPHPGTHLRVCVAFDIELWEGELENGTRL